MFTYLHSYMPETWDAQVKAGLIVCPVCKNKTNQAMHPNTEATNLLLWCRTCKTQTIVNIANGQCYEVSRCR